MDGVLIDSEPAYKIMNMEHFSELGFKMYEAEYDGYVGMSSSRMWNRIKTKYSLNQSVEELMSSEKDRMYKVLKSDLISKPIDGIKELIDSFDKNIYRLCVASSSPKDNIKLVLDRHDLEKHFDFIVSGEEVANGKPSPDIFLKAADHFQSSPDNCYVIEDSSNGVKAAKAAGMKCIAFRNVNSGIQDISKADLIINSFSNTEINKILKFIES